MFLELIAIIFAGLAVGGLVLLINRMTQGRLPRWMAPAGAGLAMIAMTIVSEYGWYHRTLATLPETVVVVQEVEQSSAYRPWTLMAPYVDRFAVIEPSATKSNKSVPGLHLTELFIFGRWKTPESATIAVDCNTNSRAALGPGTQFTETGIENVRWVSADADDPTLRVICGGA